MPHLTLEYTANLASADFDDLLLRLNEALVASGEFPEDHIKSRAVELATFRIGTQVETSAQRRGFVHVRLALHSGRSAQVKRGLSESLLGVFQHGNWPSGLDIQLCVEILDIDRESYSKLRLEPAT